jgi:hypothetical protein
MVIRNCVGADHVDAVERGLRGEPSRATMNRFGR